MGYRRAGPTPGARAPRKGRADIQGLRAVAVLLVICDHVFGQPLGGFIGVDVFFVVSGFLITHLLLSEQSRSGRISYVDFYRRRVRRIMPVATLVIAVTIVATFLLFNDTRGQSVATDGGWALVFGANWHFAQAGTDYFASGGPVSPLQHYWSLSVEEQFYVVWPTLLVATIAVARRIAPGSRRHLLVLGVVAGMLGVTSFAYSLSHSSTSPVVAYFSTFDRAWELLVGAMLASTSATWRRLPVPVRPFLAYAGLGAIAASTVLIDESAPFPAPWAALPVLGAALVIVAGIGSEPRYFLLLRNRVTTYLGDISYSLYLWHFPVVVLLLAYFPDAGLGYHVVALALTLGLSVLSFHLVEDPVRHSHWLEPRWRKAMNVGPVNHSHRLANTWIVVGALVAAVLVAGAVASTGQPTDGEQILSVAPSTADGAVDVADVADGQTEVEAYLLKRIQQSLGLKKYPQLEPSVDRLGIGPWLDGMADYGCVDVTEANVDDCSFGPDDAPTTTVVLGDSVALAYMPAVRDALPGGRVQQLTYPECPPFDAKTDRFEGGDFAQCDEFKTFARSQINAIEPDLVIVSSTWIYPNGALSSGATGQEALDEIRVGFERELRAISAPGRIVAVVSGPPGAGDLTECATSVGSPDDCEKPIEQGWFDYTDMEQEVAQSTQAYYIDTRGWFCADDYCPAFVGTTPAYVDGEHLTLQYAEQLAQPMQDALVDVVAQAAEAAAGSDAKKPGRTSSGSKTARAS